MAVVLDLSIDAAAREHLRKTLHALRHDEAARAGDRGDRNVVAVQDSELGLRLVRRAAIESSSDEYSGAVST